MKSKLWEGHYKKSRKYVDDLWLFLAFYADKSFEFGENMAMKAALIGGKGRKSLENFMKLLICKGQGRVWL